MTFSPLSVSMIFVLLHTMLVYKTMADTGVSTCFSVGVANRSIIPDQQMTASSHYNSERWALPANGRLYNSAGGWCAQTSSGNDEWLQVDLGQLTRVCGVATQGDGGDHSSGGSVMKFKLSYSEDEIGWTTYKDENDIDVEFQRDDNGDKVDKHELNPILARYIRFNPTNWHIQNCLRVEVYGISECFTNPVGVANPSIIPNEQITASSHYSPEYPPANGRLNFNSTNGWCAQTSSGNDEWLQVDLGRLTRVCGVATQGESNKWVTAFTLSYSQSGVAWTTLKDENGNEVDFQRNVEENTIDQHELKPIFARYIRFHPTERHGYNCLRAEVFGIPACFNNAVGVANPDIIPDEQMTASSFANSSYQPAYGRLNFNKADGWCASTPGSDVEWLQVDLGQLYDVCGVATQGDSQYDSRDEWVTAFKLSYSQDGETWTTYKDENGNDVTFHRNGESNTVDLHEVNPISARYIRFNPTERQGWNCLRVEVYHKIPLGSSPQMPAESCAEIDAFEEGRAVSGNYWLASETFPVYCDMASESKGWTLIARFSNADERNWMKDSGDWWYDITEAKGKTTNPLINEDMISPAFWLTSGNEFKITRSDDSQHTPLLQTTSGCLGGKTFRSKIASYGDFRDGKQWDENKDQCLGNCIVQYGGQYQNTAGFKHAQCNGTMQSFNKIGFWCHAGWSGTVMMIGGGGKGCAAAGHGVGVTAAKFSHFGTESGRRKTGFSNWEWGDIFRGCALNLWVR